jgi:cell division septal protein FtsQ
MALRARQSLWKIEEEFRDQMQLDQRRSEMLRRTAVQRTRKRRREREKARSSVRFWLLVLSLIVTAVGVTVAMFETLYYLLG